MTLFRLLMGVVSLVLLFGSLTMLGEASTTVAIAYACITGVVAFVMVVYFFRLFEEAGGDRDDV